MRASACSSLRRALTWGGMTSSSGSGLVRCFRQYRHAIYEARAMPSPPSPHQNQNQPLGISMGALMSRMSAAASEFVAALLVADDGAGTMIAEEFVFIVNGAGAAFPAFQRTCPARWRKAGRFAVEWSRCSLRGII